VLLLPVHIKLAVLWITCIMSPNACHHHWACASRPGEQFCMTEHIVYLGQLVRAQGGYLPVPARCDRWMDQVRAACDHCAYPPAANPAGLNLLRQQVRTRTNWRALLKGEPSLSICRRRVDRLIEGAIDGIMAAAKKTYGLQAISTPCKPSDRHSLPGAGIQR